MEKSTAMNFTCGVRTKTVSEKVYSVAKNNRKDKQEKRKNEKKAENWASLIFDILKENG